jgi:lysyl-tRNA synthetase class 2
MELKRNRHALPAHQNIGHPALLRVSSGLQMSMDDTNSLIEQRKAKLAALRAKGIDPFRNKFAPAESCRQARDLYAEGREVALAGRITAHRDMGKSMFIDIKDQSGRIQAYAQKNVLGDEQFEIFRHLDLGDFIGVRGTMFTTKTGEISVKLTSFVILAKALRPPPAKWHGLEDTEIRYRQRYLDLIANDEVKNIFLKRSQIVAEIRNFMHSRGYVEVETPMMQSIPGGAAAQPFVTKHNALGCQLYLRIALELYHKRLLVGGIDRVFEIGRIFRNEGLSRRHNPEFTMMEAYQAFGDYETMMELLEGMITALAEKVLGTLIVPHQRRDSFRLAVQQVVHSLEDFNGWVASQVIPSDVRDYSIQRLNLWNKMVEYSHRAKFDPTSEIANEALKTLLQFPADTQSPEFLAAMRLTNQGQDLLRTVRHNAEKLVATATKVIEPFQTLRLIHLTRPWKHVRYKDLVRERVAKKTNGKVADWFALTPQERRRVAIEDLKLEGDIAAGYEDFEVTGAVFEKLIEPTLIQPTFVTHLPKELVPLAKLSPDDPTTVEVFELCINGQEIAPGYTEQNNPIEQRERLEHQAGGEQQKLDEDFLVALEHGMPPAGGIGIGIDRLCMMLLGQESIRDVILFPQLKPK